MLRSSRRSTPEMPLSLSVLGLLVAAIVTIFQTEGTPDLGDALLGLLLLLIANSYRADIPGGLSARGAFALVRGAALYLILAGLFFAGLTEPLTQPHFAPVATATAKILPERYWYPAAWALLSLLSFLFLRKREPT